MGGDTLICSMFRNGWLLGKSSDNTDSRSEDSLITQNLGTLETVGNPAKALIDLLGTYDVTNLSVLCFTGTHLHANFIANQDVNGLTVRAMLSDPYALQTFMLGGVHTSRYNQINDHVYNFNNDSRFKPINFSVRGYVTEPSDTIILADVKDNVVSQVAYWGLYEVTGIRGNRDFHSGASPMVKCTDAQPVNRRLIKLLTDSYDRQWDTSRELR